jgi:4-aminobutyrate aminotransferase-like enzyme/Ser/Thr protein kinase RdoA (MazF antagonist)
VKTPSGDRIAWLLTYVGGDILANANPHTPNLLESIGQLLGEMDAVLEDFSHPAAYRDLPWDSARAGWIANSLALINSPDRLALLKKFLALYEAEVLPALPMLRRSVIYGDANDHNVLVSPPWPSPRHARAVIDFGDMHYGLTVSEVAIAAAYAALGKADPLAAAVSVVSGYHRSHPIRENEIQVLFPLIAIRLAVSVVISAQRKIARPKDPYVTISEAPAWLALVQFAKINSRFAHYVFRDACGLPPTPLSAAFAEYLKEISSGAASLFDVDVRREPVHILDLSVGSVFLGADPRSAEAATLSEAISADTNRHGAAVGIGRYNEARLLYDSPLFRTSATPTDEHRTVHLGMDFFVAAKTAVRAPIPGTIVEFSDNDQHLDYGPVILLKHAAPGVGDFFTLYGHLSTESLQKIKLGQHVEAGEEFAELGTADENGGWPPHLHFQIITDLLNLGTRFPGVASPSRRAVWTSISPDPNLLLGIPEKCFPASDPSSSETRSRRESVLGRNLSLSYETPLKIVRGWKQYLYEDSGRALLDVYNNVPLVGHSHPRVVRAAQEQLALLNTNTRYLHDNVVRYADRLTKLLPDPLRICFFVNSGSEANELALRLARAYTGREDILVLDHAYHGHTSALIDISPYKFNGPGGTGQKPWVHVAPLPDDYRGPYRRDDPSAGEKYAAAVRQLLEQAHSGKRHIAAFLAETLPSVAGQIVFPPNYLAEAYRHVRATGAICVADEVQVGFGRLGTHFWGFQTQGVVPDVVVLGKPIGNAFPLAAVVTTPEIAASFANGMEFFSTFGGNPVACAAGLAVLDVLLEENLQQNALQVGTHLKQGLHALERKHAIIGDVRGSGLFLGIDFVADRETREPAPLQASYIVNRLRERGILTGTDGPGHNVLKLRPPLIFNRQDADLFVATLDSVLAEDPARP